MAAVTKRLKDIQEIKNLAIKIADLEVTTSPCIYTYIYTLIKVYIYIHNGMFGKLCIYIHTYIFKFFFW